MRQDSKSGPRRTLEDLRLPWSIGGDEVWRYRSPVATSSAIFKHEVQWRGFPLPVALEPVQHHEKVSIDTCCLKHHVAYTFTHGYVFGLTCS